MEIIVKIPELIVSLTENREAHVAAYQTAITKYREKALEWFEDSIEKVRNGGQIEHHLMIPIPEEHTEDFDRAIDMLQWHTEPTITLTEHQFEELVRNRWGWHRTFTANTGSYLAS